MELPQLIGHSFCIEKTIRNRPVNITGQRNKWLLNYLNGAIYTTLLKNRSNFNK